MRERLRGIVPLLPLAVATAVLARAAIAGVLAKVGHPAAALDDAYIHFQYARAFAEGHPFRYEAGEPISTGATSFAWPILLALPYALGMKGETIMWAAWAISFVALGALAWEASALAKPLAGRAAALGAGAMTLCFGGLVWCAASGMEVVLFAWVVASGTRRAADWVEDPEKRTKRALYILLAFAAAAPLVRPEGAITSVVLGVAVALYPSAQTVKARAPAAAFLLAAILPNLFVLLLTGHLSTSTAQVKLLWKNPYYDLWSASAANARTLVGTILNGEVWSAEFLPKGGAPIAFAGLAALAMRGYATKKTYRAAAILVFALSMFVPCTYVTFLWNRLRYLWPFAPGWFIGLACLARVVGLLAMRIDRRAAGITTTLLAGGFAGMLVVRLEWVLEDVAQSASGIDRQQAALGRWADANLPRDARIGVNDTGAIAYFGNRKTFDVVGLTTPSEGRYWVAGAASRFEHYEQLPASALPTHFIIYPEWMGLEPVLGHSLTEAVVTDSTILGGTTMRAYEARWTYLRTGATPWTAHGAIADELDVADVDSEQAHAYALWGARENEQTTEEGNAPSGAIVVDGGRTNRTLERFTVKLPAGKRMKAIARLASSHADVPLTVRIDGKELAKLVIAEGPWQELAFEMPENARVVELASDGGRTFTSFHYWFGDL